MRTEERTVSGAGYDRDRLSNRVVAVVLLLFCIVLIIWYAIRTNVTEVKTSDRPQGVVTVTDMDRIPLYENTRVGDVDVSGLTVGEAREKVQEYLDGIFDTVFKVRVAQDKEIEVSLRQLSAYWVNPEAIEEAAHLKDGRDVVARYTLGKDLEESGLEIPLEVSLQKEAAINWLTANCSIYDVEMTGSELITVDGTAKVKLGRVGQTLNISEAVAQLMNSGFDFVKNGENVFTLPLEELYPASTPEGYEDYPGINELVMEAEAAAYSDTTGEEAAEP